MEKPLLIDVPAEPFPSPAGRGRLVRFAWGLIAGLWVDALVAGGLGFLKARDTSVKPWETLAFGGFAAAVCVAPAQLTVSAALATLRRARFVALGLAIAAALGLAAWIGLFFWAAVQANAYARSHHLA